MDSARQSQLNRRSFRNNGFTLIEMLVVVFIVGIFVTAVSLRLMQGANIESKYTAKQLYALFGLVQELAILQPGVFAFVSDNKGYGFLEYQLDNTSWQGKWVDAAENNPILHYRKLPRGITLQRVMDKDATNPTNIIFSNSGNFTPFTLLIGPTGKKSTYKVTGSSDGTLQWSSLQ